MVQSKNGDLISLPGTANERLCATRPTAPKPNGHAGGFKLCKHKKSQKRGKAREREREKERTGRTRSSRPSLAASERPNTRLIRTRLRPYLLGVSLQPDRLRTT